MSALHPSITTNFDSKSSADIVSKTNTAIESLCRGNGFLLAVPTQWKDQCIMTLQSICE